MFKSKYQKALNILDDEIRIAQCYFNTYASYSDYNCIEDLELRNEMLTRNLKIMDKYLCKLETLRDLKIKILEEIGE